MNIKLTYCKTGSYYHPDKNSLNFRHPSGGGEFSLLRL